MSWFVVDVEADGPCPGVYSMIQLGVVRVDASLKETFYAEFMPLPSATYDPAALKVVGVTREEVMRYPSPEYGMIKFDQWLRHTSLAGPPRFISDNNGFDWQFVNYYFHYFLRKNPFGHSSTNLGSLYKGLVKDFGQNFKHLRKTRHTHNPVDDAMGNAEALEHMITAMNLKMKGTV